MFWFGKWLFVQIIGIITIIILTGFMIIKVTDFPKDAILNTYNTLVQFLGEESLTSDKKLKGKREYGVDHYVGTYYAEYSGNTGKEILFGGTVLSRKNGDHITVQIKLEKVEGNIKVINRMGEKEIIILEDTGEYEDTIYIEGMSYYLVVELDNFKGKLKVDVN